MRILRNGFGEVQATSGMSAYHSGLEFDSVLRIRSGGTAAEFQPLTHIPRSTFWRNLWWQVFPRARPASLGQTPARLVRVGQMGTDMNSELSRSLHDILMAVGVNPFMQRAGVMQW